MPKRISLSEWIQGVLSDPFKEGKCTALSLVHMQGSIPKEIYTVKLGGRDISPTELGSLFQGKAEGYVQEIPGVQTFNLLAFYNNESSPQAEHPFIINSENKFEGLATEPPTERGTLQQGMRLTEVIVQRVIGQISVVMNHTEAILTRSDRRMEHLEEENREMFALMRDMLMQQANLEHDKRIKELEYERKTEERKQWLKFAPALINTIAGREIFPQSTADTALVESIADAISEEDISKIASVLPPQLWGPLASRMQSHLEKKRKNAEDPRLLPKGVESELG
jgi:hypothetical protein